MSHNRDDHHHQLYSVAQRLLLVTTAGVAGYNAGVRSKEGLTHAQIQQIRAQVAIETEDGLVKEHAVTRVMCNTIHDCMLIIRNLEYDDKRKLSEIVEQFQKVKFITRSRGFMLL